MTYFTIFSNMNFPIDLYSTHSIASMFCGTPAYDICSRYILQKAKLVLALSSWLDIKQQQPVGTISQHSLTNRTTWRQSQSWQLLQLLWLLSMVSEQMRSNTFLIKCIIQDMITISNGPLLARLLRNVLHQVGC